MQPSIVIAGGGGHASDVANLLERLRLRDRVVGYIDDAGEAHRMLRWGIPLLGDLTMQAQADLRIVLGVGMPQARRTVLARLEGWLGVDPLVDPSVAVGHLVVLGLGTVVLAGTALSPMVEVGEHAYISQLCSIGHDARLGRNCCVMPGATISGDTMIGDDVLIGTNAAVLQGVAIGAGATVGAGAVVLRNVDPGATVVGSPARPLSRQ